MDELHGGVVDEFLDVVDFVRLGVEDALDAAVHESLETVVARTCGDVDVRAVDADTVFRGLGDGVYFGVDRAEAIFLFLAVRIL